MPLYLVRWPGLEASLIRASSEEHLIDVIDEVGDPGACTWEIYRGPLWINFSLPAKYKVRKSTTGRIEPADVVVADVAKVAEFALDVDPYPECDTGEWMRHAIMRSAFPRVESALDGPDEEADVEAVVGAVVRELVEHDRTTSNRGVTLDADLRLLLTEARYYRRARPGHFTALAAQTFDDFCYGRASIAPDADGLVRVACVEVVRQAKRAQTALLKTGVALRADQKGTIIDAHRVDAYRDGATLPGSERLRDRRNESVMWTLRGADLKALTAIVRRDEGCELDRPAPAGG